MHQEQTTVTTRLLDRRLAVVALLGSVATAAAQAPEYAVADIDALLGSPGFSSVRDVNENGDAVGDVFVGTGYQAFVYTYESGAQLLPLVGGNPEAVAVALTDRDPAGQIVIAGSVGELGLDIIWENASAAYWRVEAETGTVLDSADIAVVAGYGQARAVDLNNAGKLIGYAFDGGPFQPFVHDTTTGLTATFSFPATPAAINNSDQVGGGTFIGLFRFDNFNGRLTERSGTFDGANPLTDVEGTAFDAPAADIPLPNLGSNDPISATIFVADEGASASIASVSEDGRTAGPIAFPAGAAFDTDDALQFAMFRGNTGERFELKSLRVTVSGDVSVIPLPASAWLLGAGLAGIAAFARRRHRA